MRYLLILIVFFSIANGYSYSDQLMQIYAKISPRIVLMSKMPYSIPENSIDIIILYEKGDGRAAENLRKKMLQIYPEGLKGRKLEIELIPYGEDKKLRKVSMLFFMEGDIDSVVTALDFAKKNRVLTISYSKRLLAYGVILSLYIGKTVKPFLNLEAARSRGIVFDNILFKISKIYSSKSVQ